MSPFKGDHLFYLLLHLHNQYMVFYRTLILDMKPFWVLFDFINPEIQINLQGDEDPILVPSAKPQIIIQY